VSPLETRKTFIEQIFKEYDEVQTEIESLDLSSEAIETQTQDRDEIDLKYLDVLSSIQTKIRQTTPPPHTAATANPNGRCSSANSHCSNRDQSIKLNLPTLNLNLSLVAIRNGCHFKIHLNPLLKTKTTC
jgi:hypothetical protein